MEKYLAEAKFRLSLKKKTSSAELVLAHLLQMQTIQTSFKSKEIKTIILGRLPNMSDMQFRKALHELRKSDVLKKQFGIYTLNK